MKWMDEGEKAHLEIIENGLLGVCVGYYVGGNLSWLFWRKPFFYYIFWIFAILM